jgi:hypothetical protein
MSIVEAVNVLLVATMFMIVKGKNIDPFGLSDLNK